MKMCGHRYPKSRWKCRGANTPDEPMSVIRSFPTLQSRNFIISCTKEIPVQ